MVFNHSLQATLGLSFAPANPASLAAINVMQSVPISFTSKRIKYKTQNTMVQKAFCKCYINLIHAYTITSMQASRHDTYIQEHPEAETCPQLGTGIQIHLQDKSLIAPDCNICSPQTLPRSYNFFLLLSSSFAVPSSKPAALHRCGFLLLFFRVSRLILQPIRSGYELTSVAFGLFRPQKSS